MRYHLRDQITLRRTKRDLVSHPLGPFLSALFPPSEQVIAPQNFKSDSPRVQPLAEPGPTNTHFEPERSG